MTQAYDAIVVGLGGHGSATLYHLAKLGLKVLKRAFAVDAVCRIFETKMQDSPLRNPASYTVRFKMPKYHQESFERPMIPELPFSIDIQQQAFGQRGPPPAGSGR